MLLFTSVVVRRHPSKYGVKSAPHRKSSADHAKAVCRPDDGDETGSAAPKVVVRSQSHGDLLDDDHAAAKIQAGVRGYLTRKQVQETKRRKSDAAVKIQSNFRGFRTRKHMEDQGLLSPRSSRSSGDRSPRRSLPQTPEVPENTDNPLHGHLENEDDAATKIQAQMRGFLTRKELEKETHAAEKIQAVYRGFHVRKELGDKG